MPILNPKTSKKGIAPLLISALLIALSACTPQNTAVSAAKPESITVAWPNDATTLDPAWSATDQNNEVSMNVYQTLVGYEYRDGDDGSRVAQGLVITPGLAEKWTIDGSTATFHLRQNVKFYPSGNPLTAADVKFSLERNLGKTGGPELTSSGIYTPQQIEIIDPATVALHYTDAQGSPAPASPASLAALRFATYGIVDSATALSHATTSDPDGGAWLAQNVAGTGPYYIDSRTPGQSLTLKAVPGAWSGEPAFSTVRINVVNDANVSSLLKGNTVNVGLYGLTPKDVNSLRGSGFRAVHAPTQNYLELQLASDTGPLANPLVRQAIAHALPYDKIVQQVYFGDAERSLSFVSPHASGYTPSWQTYGDPQKARQLMDQAGSPSINITLQYSNEAATYESTALLIKDALDKIGIKVTLQSQTTSTVLSSILARGSGQTATPAADMILFNISVYLEDAKAPTNLWATSHGVLNFSHFSNPKVDELQKTWASQGPGNERDKAYSSIQDIAADDASFLPIATIGRSIVTVPGITGITFQPEIGVRYSTLVPSK
ncbi:ABC transporter substrate-binding protein [Pseudarthrobacter phenanthrenivorans]|uniref:ABC transporter substrate-binding protein n=1 Tax=Pseudarthrobacter phenanthrenivorans TaxID=361575 RepID=UPI002F35B8F0